MKFPYGMSDFYKLRTHGYAYVDRTAWIRRLEHTGEYLLLLRPRRFGKSLLVSMLENYYDVAKADDFNRLFGSLAIGQQPTDLHNQYLVLKWDFSAVSPLGDALQIQQNLYDYLNSRIRGFAKYYETVLTEEILINPSNPLDSFQSLLIAIKQCPYNLYLLIDEYDNFANEVMMTSGEIGQQRYEELVYGEGCLKSLFKVIKSATAGLGLDKTFMTGVSPVVMSDLTSAHNITKNIYLLPDFEDICGFTEAELRGFLDQLVAAGRVSSARSAEALAMMRTYYNGYAFTYDRAPSIYNPTLALYFLDHLQEYGEYPREVLDNNLATDYLKLVYVSRLPGGEQVISNTLNDERPFTIQQLALRFGMREMIHAKDDENLTASLLYYLGMLTLSGVDAMGQLVLRIPNLVARRLYVERLQDLLLPDLKTHHALQVVNAFYNTGDMQPLCELLEQRYLNVFDNRDYRWTNELTLKTIFLMVLFNDTFYLMDSETALERGYADLTMLVRPDMRKYALLDIIIEFKYLSLQEVGLNGTQIKQMPVEELRALQPVQDKLAEANTALEGYRRTLAAHYGDRLRLHAYSVVAVGFERLIFLAV